MTNEELCIVVQSGTGDRIAALGELFNQNAGMIEKVIRQYRGIEDLDDLRQQSYFGVVKAAERWKPDRGASFIHYAKFWIMQVVRRYIDNCGSLVRVPVPRRGQIVKYHKAVNEYRSSFGQEPSNDELCELLDINANQLDDLKRDAAALRVHSTSAPIGEDGEETIEDTIADPSTPISDCIDKIQREELAETLWSCVDGLKAQQREVIRGRYKDGKTLNECGADLGVSPERVRAIESNALRELRSGKHVLRLRPYLTNSGAYSFGIRNSGLGTFKRHGSSQEIAIMQLEEQTGIRLCGKEFVLHETSCQA